MKKTTEELRDEAESSRLRRLEMEKKALGTKKEVLVENKDLQKADDDKREDRAVFFVGIALLAAVGWTVLIGIIDSGQITHPWSSEEVQVGESIAEQPKIISARDFRKIEAELFPEETETEEEFNRRFMEEPVPEEPEIISGSDFQRIKDELFPEPLPLQSRNLTSKISYPMQKALEAIGPAIVYTIVTGFLIWIATFIYGVIALRKEAKGLQQEAEIARKEGDINDKQRKILKTVLYVVAGMLLFPPVFYKERTGGVEMMEYVFILNGHGRIAASVLLTQWVGVLIVGGIAFFLNKDR